jgi:hypothetical protein
LRFQLDLMRVPKKIVTAMKKVRALLMSALAAD